MSTNSLDADRRPLTAAGYWRLVCEDTGDLSDDDDCGAAGRTQADEVWHSLRYIDLDAPGLFSKTPDRRLKSSRSTYISCYTADCNDQEKVRLAAEFIRRTVHFPFSISYYACNAGIKVPLFHHTPEGRLYENTEHGCRRVPQNPPAESDGDVPSETFDKQYLHLPSTPEGIKKMSDEKGGKWMVFSPPGGGGGALARHDATWLAMKSLYRRGVFVGLKASTAVLNPANQLSVQGVKRSGPVVHCYTADAEDRADVQRAAVAIRSVADSEYMMYYKTNMASIKGQYPQDGKWSVTKYQHTVEGGLCERDSLNRYKLVVPPTEGGGEM